MKLFAHQEEVVNRWRDNPQEHRALIYHSVGFGKSITAMEMLKARGIKDVLITTPAATKKQWAEYAKQYKVNATIVTLEWFRKQAKDTLAKLPKTWICDEMQALSNPKSLGYKKALMWSRMHPDDDMIYLSGTPFWNDSNANVYGVVHSLWKFQGGLASWIYANCIIKYNPYSFLPDIVAYKEGLEGLLEQYPFVHVVKSEYEYHPIDIELGVTGGEQIPHVNKYSMIQGVNSKEEYDISSIMEKNNALSMLNYCDIDIVDGEKVYVNLAYELPIAIKARIDKHKKVLIYSHSVPLARLLTEALGDSAVLVTGELRTKQNGKEFNKALDRFINGNVPALVCTDVLAAGFDGVQNVCNTLIIFNDTLDNARRQQLIGRVARKGQKTKDNGSYDVNIIRYNVKRIAGG